MNSHGKKKESIIVINSISKNIHVFDLSQNMYSNGTYSV